MRKPLTHPLRVNSDATPTSNRCHCPLWSFGGSSTPWSWDVCSCSATLTRRGRRRHGHDNGVAVPTSWPVGNPRRAIYCPRVQGLTARESGSKMQGVSPQWAVGFPLRMTSKGCYDRGQRKSAPTLIRRAFDWLPWLGAGNMSERSDAPNACLTASRVFVGDTVSRVFISQSVAGVFVGDTTLEGTLAPVGDSRQPDHLGRRHGRGDHAGGGTAPHDGVHRRPGLRDR